VNELGRISTIIYNGAELSYPTQDRTAGSTKTTQTKIADDDAAAASIRSVHRREATGAYQSIRKDDSPNIWPETMAEFIEAVREKVARFLQLLEQIARGRFIYGDLAENMAQIAANLQSGKSSPTPAGQETLKIQPFSDIDPEQVLFLLRND
jgi:hypothetical protein